MGLLLKPITYFLDNGLSPNWGTIIVWLIIIVIFLSSGFISATISETKGHSRLIHFIAGLLIPFIYPAAIFKFLPDANTEIILKDEDIDPQTGEPIAKRVKLKGEAGEEAAKAARQQAQSGSEDSDFEEEEDAYEEGAINQHYMSSISVDSDGNPQGPFILELNDGTAIEVSRIANPLPTLAVFELASDGKSRTIRIPYEKIVSCALKE